MQTRRVVGSVLGALLVVMLVAVTWWSVSFYRAHTTDDGWQLVNVDGDRIVVQVTTSACTWVHRPRVHESADEVDVRVRTTDQPLPCSGRADLYNVTVELSAPLGDRTLVGCHGPAYGYDQVCGPST